MPAFSRRTFVASSLGALATYSLSEAAELPTQPLAPWARLSSSLFLTWWTDPTTTMVIQWIDLAAAPELVSYAPLHSPEWKVATVSTKPFPDTDLVVYRCELRGLTPGTEYVFHTGAREPRRRFRTLPEKATDTFTFVSGGDCGTGSHAIATNQLAARQDPYFAMIGGDLAYDNGKSPSTFLKFLQNYSRYMVDTKGRHIPMLSCLGNHEVNGGYKGQRSAAAHYLSVFDGFYDETTYGVMDIGDYLSLVLLDTGHISPIKGEQTDWLGTALASRQDRPHLIVANHVPAYPSYRASEDTGRDNRKYWCPLFERYQVDVVLEHHDHTFKRSHPMKGGLRDKHGVLYLGDGSWGQLRAANKPELRPYLAAYGESYHVSVHRLEGEQRFHVALTDSGRVADVCMTASKRPARRG